MLVGAEYFRGERLLPLAEAGRLMHPERSKLTLINWHKQGQLNQSGSQVFLRVCPLPSGNHTSLEEIERYLRAVSGMTVSAQVVGGSLHGCTVQWQTSEEDVVAGDLSDQVKGRVVPQDEVYVPMRFRDKRGKVRTFLVYKEFPDGREVVIKMLEGE